LLTIYWIHKVVSAGRGGGRLGSEGLGGEGRGVRGERRGKENRRAGEQ